MTESFDILCLSGLPEYPQGSVSLEWREKWNQALQHQLIFLLNNHQDIENEKPLETKKREDYIKMLQEYLANSEDIERRERQEEIKARQRTQDGPPRRFWFF